MSRFRIALAALTVAGALSACGGAGGAVDTAATNTAAAPAALQFSAPSVGGGAIDFTQFAGKPVVLWFWAPTLTTCNREAPSVEAASIRWAGQVQFVGVAWFGDDDSFQGFIDKHGLTFPQVSDGAGEVFDRFEIPSQPAFVIIDANGTEQQLFGAVDGDVLDGLIADVLP